MEVKAIINSLKLAFPEQDACSWDYVGWQVKSFTKTKVTKVLLALDISKQVITKAIAEKIELIICHHPLIFSCHITQSTSYKKNYTKN